jgi:hypothetical protein
MKKIMFLTAFIAAFAAAALAGTGPIDHFVVTMSAGPVTAGIPVQVTVAAYDSTDNSDIKTDYAGPAIFSSSMGGDVIVSPTNSNIVNGWNNSASGPGYWTGIIQIGKPGAANIQIQDASVHTALGSAVITIYIGPYTKLKVLTEGMIFAPGTLSGHTGTWVTLTTTAPFAVTVYTTDDWYNPVTPQVKSEILLQQSFTGYYISSTPYPSADLSGITMAAYFTATVFPNVDQASFYNVYARDIDNNGIQDYSLSPYFISLTDYYILAQAPSGPITANTNMDITVTISHFQPQGTTPGTPIPGFNDSVQIEAVDTNGNTLAPGLARLLPQPVLSKSTLNGVAVFTASYTRTGGALGTIRIKPSYTGTNIGKPVDNQGQSNSLSSLIYIFADAPASFTASSGASTLNKNDSTQVSAHVLDQYYNPVTGTAVNFSIPFGQGVLNTTTAYTDSAGTAAVTYTAPAGNMQNIVEVSVPGITAPQDITIISELTDKFENWPNPFVAGRETTMINYSLPEDSEVKLRLYSVFGKLVWSKNIAKGELGNNGEQHGKRGGNTVVWNGVGDKGFTVGSGVYILKLTIKNSKGTSTQTRNIAVTK